MLQAAVGIRIVAAALASIHGVVRSSGNGVAAAGAFVQVDGIELAMTDSVGRYTITGLTAGPHQLRISAIGFDSREVTLLLSDGSDLRLDLEVTTRPVVLQPIAVHAGALLGTPGAFALLGDQVHEPGQYRFAQDWKESQLAGGADLNHLLSTLPGVATRGDNSSGLSFRGGNGSQTQLLLNGIPLYGATHFAGASSAINPDALASIDVHTGVASVRYDGSLSGVVDLQTTDLRSTRLGFSGSASISDARSVVEAPIGSGMLLLGVRRSFHNLLTDATRVGGVNHYQDLLAVGTFGLGGGTLRLLTMASANDIRWEPHTALDTPVEDGGDHPALPIGADAALWDSRAIGASWTVPSGGRGSFSSAIWWSGSATRISANLSDSTRMLSSGISEFGVRVEQRQSFLSGYLLIGSEITGPRTWYQVRDQLSSSAQSISPIAESSNPLLGSAYAEWGGHLSRRTDLRIGLRGNTDFGPLSQLAPRVLIAFWPDTSTRIEAGFGRTHQVIQSMLNEENLTSTVVSPMLPIATNAAAPIARSDAWQLSVTRRLGRVTTLSLEGYRRSWHDVLTPAAATTDYFGALQPVYLAGRSSGLMATFASSWRRLAVNTTAGLAKATYFGSAGSFNSGYESPLFWSGDVNLRMGKGTAMQLGWAAGSGQPVSAILPTVEWQSYNPGSGLGEIEGLTTNLSGAVNAFRLPPRLRVDAGLRKTWSFGGTTTGTGISASIRVVNVLNRANPVGLVAGTDGLFRLLPGTPRGVVFELGWVY